MEKKVILGGVLGAAAMLLFTISLLFVVSEFSTGSVLTGGATVVGIIAVLLSAVAGGFLAGLIGHSNPRRAGLIAGLGAGVVLSAAWLVISGMTFQSIISGTAIIFTWGIIARVAGGFARQRK